MLKFHMYYILIIIAKFCVGLIIGINLYQRLITGKLGSRLLNFYLSYKGSNLFYIHMFLFLFLCFNILSLIDYTIVYYLQSEGLNLYDDVLYRSHTCHATPSNDGETPKVEVGVNVDVKNVNVGGINLPASGLADGIRALGNSGIKAGGITGGVQCAKSCSTVAGKVGAVVGGVLIGGGAIVLKDLASDVKNILGGSSTSSYTSSDKFSIVLGRTGDNMQDFLYAFGTFHSVQLSIVFALSIYFTIIYFKPKLISFGEKLPSSIKNYYLKILNSWINLNYGLIIYFWILLIISLLLCNYYFDFFIDNFDTILKFYKK